MLREYFEAKIGQTITRTVTTGKWSFSEVYARRYKADILGIGEDGARIHIQSTDITPSGATESGTRRYLGDYDVPLNVYGLTEFWYKLLSKADPQFARGVQNQEPEE